MYSQPMGAERTPPPSRSADCGASRICAGTSRLTAMRFVEVRGNRLSAIGLGTWQFGSEDWGYGSQYADVEAGRILQRALDLGVNVIDTAEIYGRGNSERIVGKALGDRRKDAFVATKVLPLAPTANRVEKHGRNSAQRLGIDVIDLYQIHWPNPLVPI